VVAPDQRGHGESARPEGPYDRDAFVADAAAVVRALGGGPAVLVGHSMGALNAWQLAARRPELAAGLVICDMRAAAPGEASQRAWEEWLAAWPVPFASREAAREWFATRDPWATRPRPGRADYFAGLMVRAADGWRPHFEPRHMLRAREGWATEPHWDELAAIGCPALVVRGGYGVLGRAEAQEMVRVLPHGAYAEVPDAGHHLPWERPEEWHALLGTFLAGLRTGTTPAAPAPAGP
jgi:pimeloyl-ACP methyl ester carboxylesterase